MNFLAPAFYMGLALLLELACRAGLVSPIAVVPPSEMIAAAAGLLVGPSTWLSIGVTLGSIALAGLAAIVSGFLLGLLLSRLQRLRPFIDFIMSIYYAVPIFVFYPVLLVVFGIGIGPIVGIAYLYALAAMIVGTLVALDRIPRVLAKTASVMRLSRRDTVLAVSLPAALPHLMGGVRVAVGYAFVGVVASEFILSSAGIGHGIALAYETFRTREMYGLLVVLAILVLLTNRGLGRLQAAMSGQGGAR